MFAPVTVLMGVLIIYIVLLRYDAFKKWVWTRKVEEYGTQPTTFGNGERLECLTSVLCPGPQPTASVKEQPSFYIGLLQVLILMIPLISGYGYSASVGTSEYILFERYGSAYRMNADGSDVQLIQKLAERPVCSPTGDGIVFARLGRDPTGQDLFWSDPSGNSVRRLTRGLSIPPRFSVSGNGIVGFAPGYRGSRDLYTVRISDGVVVQHTNGFDVGVFEWSPEGKYLGFIAAGRDQKRAYYVLDYASGATKRIADFELLYLSPSLSWSPDGQSLALFQSQGIEIIDMKTGSSRRLPRPRVIHDIRWSPDGQYLAGVRSDEECHPFSGNIYVIKLSDNTEKKVSNHWFRCRTYHSPRWSPDGMKVIFLANRQKGDMDFTPFTKYIWDNIYIVNRAGSGQTNLSANEDVKDENPMWCKEPMKN